MAEDAHGHASGSHAAHGPEGRVDPDIAPAKSDSSHTDVESGHSHHGHSLLDTALTQILGIAILEFGVTLHRFVNLARIALLTIF